MYPVPAETTGSDATTRRSTTTGTEITEEEIDTLYNVRDYNLLFCTFGIFLHLFVIS